MSLTATLFRRPALGLVGAVAFVSVVYAHGEVTPQPVNTEALPDLGEEWLPENPYRNAEKEVWLAAIEIGASGYNQNCARCHGLGAVSGGLAPDLRYLEASDYGDEWYVERFVHGYTQNGVTKMPGFGDLLDQKAAWAIRTYVETRPDEGALDAHNDRLKQIRDQLAEWSNGTAADADGIAAVQAELAAIAEQVETASGAPIADSIAAKAARELGDSPESMKRAAETLTVGLSAAQ